MHTGIDHMLLGVNDLDRGIEWVEQRTGVRAAFGGVHPGRGTRNALLALGPNCYLEIIAPDPQQHGPVWFSRVLALQEPKLVAWAAHTSDLAAAAQSAVAAGFEIDGPNDGARTRPDGRLLSWKLFHVRNNPGELLPFFIEWNRDSVHPSADAPAGCILQHFELQSPDATELTRACQRLAIEVAVQPRKAPLMLARLASPKGDVELTS